jgi:hypothetical protein
MYPSICISISLIVDKEYDTSGARAADRKGAHCVIEVMRITVRKAVPIAVIAIAWWASFHLNAWVFAGMQHTSVASWVFLPAVFRPLAILMYDKIGAVGLVLGGYLTVYGTTHGDNVHEVMLSVVSGVTPYFAVTLGKRLLAIPSNLAGLRMNHIIVLSASCAASNAIVLNGYMWASGHLNNDFMQVATVFVGDIIGATIMLFLISSVLAFALPRQRRN